MSFRAIRDFIFGKHPEFARCWKCDRLNEVPPGATLYSCWSCKESNLGPDAKVEFQSWGSR